MTETGIDAVLFDLHNTTMDGSYASVGVASVASVIAPRWGVAEGGVDQGFWQGVRAVMGRYHSLDFYLMGDVFADAFRQIAATAGVEPSDDELAELIDLMWEANLPAVRPMDGAIETFDALRASGRGVGVVSWADEGVFDRLIEQLGFGDHVDVAVCSETARSCKPHPGIFQYALDALGVPPGRAMFVGDSIDQDIVGGNRLGMTTVLVDATRYSSDIGAFGDDPLTVPDHRTGALTDVLDLVSI